MRFTEYVNRPWKDVLDSVPVVAVDVVSQLVKYQSDARLPAAEVNSICYQVTRRPTDPSSQVLRHPLFHK